MRKTQWSTNNSALRLVGACLNADGARYMYVRRTGNRICIALAPVTGGGCSGGGMARTSRTPVPVRPCHRQNKATPVAAQCRTAAAPAPATGTVPPTLAGAAPSLPSCAATCCDVYMARPHRVRVKSSQTVWAKFVFQNLLFANLFQDYMKKKISSLTV